MNEANTTNRTGWMTGEAFVNHRYRCGVACGNAAPYTRVGNEMARPGRSWYLEERR